jgi:hypothetical protein
MLKMLKIKNIRPVIKYLRELSIVVIGVAITVGIGFWINNNSLKKDQKLYLDAIKLELEENVKQFDYLTKWLQKSNNYALYLHFTDKKSLDKDTLSYYSQTDNDGCGYTYAASMSAMISTNAFEMYKSSGAMRQMKNKEKLQAIWEAYVRIEMAQTNIDNYFRIKEDEVMRYARLKEEGKIIDVPMQVFYTSGMPGEMTRWSSQTSEVLKKILIKLE